MLLHRHLGVGVKNSAPIKEVEEKKEEKVVEKKTTTKKAIVKK